MFKRVDKRRRKKEEEEKLGLDEEVKEILGIQDTDSEESESESDSDEEESDVDQDMDDQVEDNEEEEEEEEEEDSLITVSQALKDPLYIISILPDVKACIVCPGKLLKSIKMVQLHRTSNAHIRRFKQFSDDSADANPNDNAGDILKRNSETKPLITSGVSKRAEKKKASQARRKARRAEIKAKAKAKKAKTTSESTPAQPAQSSKDTSGSTSPKPPPKKKQKVDIPGHQVLSSPAKISTAPGAPSAPPATKKRNKKESANVKPAPVTDSACEASEPSNIQDSVKIQDIVKSTSNRAKTARSRALSMSKNTSRLTTS